MLLQFNLPTYVLINLGEFSNPEYHEFDVITFDLQLKFAAEPLNFISFLGTIPPPTIEQMFFVVKMRITIAASY